MIHNLADRADVGIEDKLTTTSVIVEMSLDITAHDTPQCPDQLVHLSRVGTADSVGDTDTVDTDLVDGAVNGQQVDKLGSERVFGRESDLDTLRLDKFDDLNGAIRQYSTLMLDQFGSASAREPRSGSAISHSSPPTGDMILSYHRRPARRTLSSRTRNREEHSRLGDPGHVLAVRVFPQERRRANDDINTVHTGLDGDTRIVHVASDVGENLGPLEAELTDSFAVSAGFGRGGGRGQFDVFDTELIESVGQRWTSRVVRV